MSYIGPAELSVIKMTGGECIRPPYPQKLSCPAHTMERRPNSNVYSCLVPPNLRVLMWLYIYRGFPGLR